MGLSTIDAEIANYYAQTLLLPLTYGENGVFFWFPGSGMTTITRDVFSSKNTLTKYLHGLAGRIKIIQLWGNTTDQKTLPSLLASAGFSTKQELVALCTQQLTSGNEIACIVGRIDDYPSPAKISILRFLVALNSLNKRRIHIIINSVDRPWFEQALHKYPELVSLFNTTHTIPVLNARLLDKFISHNAATFNFTLSLADRAKLISSYGGILLLIREYIRSHGSHSTLNLKLAVIWKSLPVTYKAAIENFVVSKRGYPSVVKRDFDTFGVTSLTVFKDHWVALDTNPEKILPQLLTSDEKALWRLFTTSAGKLVSKESVFALLRPQGGDNVTDWTIDQAMSRFRKKLARAGIDPTLIKTIKRKGYIYA